MSNRRNNLLINPTFQYQLIFLFFVPFVATIIIIGVFFYSFTNPILEELTQLNLPPEHPLNLTLNDIKDNFILMISLTIFSLSCIFSFTFLSISNKIAGPLYNLQTQLNHMTASGDVKKIKFRQKDYFKELEESFNSFIEHFFNKDKADKK